MKPITLTLTAHDVAKLVDGLEALRIAETYRLRLTNPKGITGTTGRITKLLEKIHKQIEAKK